MKREICAFSFAALLLLTGCERLFQAHSKNALERGDQKAGLGQYREAILDYEAALDGTVETAEVHFKLGLIYDDKLKNPASALHHFTRYQELAPTGSHTKEVRNLIKEAEFKIASVVRGASISQVEAAKLKNENLALRKQIAELRAQPRTPTVGSQNKNSTPAAQKPVPEGARTYVVQPGDTLASISRRFYKTTGRWKDIQDANFYQLEGTARLQPGMTLMIP